MLDTLRYRDTLLPEDHRKDASDPLIRPDTIPYHDPSGGRVLAVVSNESPALQETSMAVVVPASWSAGTGEQDRQHFVRAWRASDRLGVPVINIASHELPLRALWAVKGGDLGPVARQQTETLGRFLREKGARNLGQVVIYGPSLGGSGALTYRRSDGTVGGFHNDLDVLGFGAHAPANLNSERSLWKRWGETPSTDYAEVMLSDPRYRQEYLRELGLDPDTPLEEAVRLAAKVTGKNAAKITARHAPTNGALVMSLRHDTLGDNVSEFLKNNPSAVFVGSRGEHDPVTPAESFESTISRLQLDFGKRAVGHVITSRPWTGRGDIFSPPEPESNHGLVDDPDILAHRASEVLQLHAQLNRWSPSDW